MQRILALEHLAKDTQRIRSGQLRGMHPGGPQALLFAGDGFALGAERRPALIVDQPQAASNLGQPQVGVVLAQRQAILGATGEHAVRFGNAAGDQVVCQHTEVGLITARRPRLPLLHLQRRVGAGQQALRSSLLVAGGAVDLAGEKQTADGTGLERSTQAPRVEVVVFDRVSRAQDVAALETMDRTNDRQLHVERQAGRNAVRVDLVGLQTLRLEKDVMAVLGRETMDLVLDRRAVTRPDALDDPGVHR
ncbi:MAG: hypothetical protein AW07_03697 [Candidatus Accumulibacter sp. SK-11]|nr:MAG: hypothetical protein AW07_03697 [Candidatus Accumulibacter sp. SK-11]